MNLERESPDQKWKYMMGEIREGADQSTLGIPASASVTEEMFLSAVDDGRILVDQRSTAIATALPPPRHSAAIPRFTSRRIISYISVTSTRAPLAPIGWPIATAPPFTLTFSGFSFSSRMTPSA